MSKPARPTLDTPRQSVRQERPCRHACFAAPARGRRARAGRIPGSGTREGPNGRKQTPAFRS